MGEEPVGVVLERLGEVVGQVEGLCRGSSGWGDAQREAVLAGVGAACTALTLARSWVLAAHQEAGGWAGSGDRDFASWLGRTSGAGRQVARREARLAEQLPQLPAARREVEGGRLGLEHARVLTDLRARASAAVRRALGEGGEAQLVALAGSMDAGAFAGRVAAWAAGVDAQEVETSHARVRAGRHLRSYRFGGGRRFEVFTDEVSGAQVMTALEAVAGKPAAGDERTREQRLVDALAAMAQGALGSGKFKPGAQIRPHLALLVPAATWAAYRSMLHAAGDGAEGAAGAFGPGIATGGADGAGGAADAATAAGGAGVTADPAAAAGGGATPAGAGAAGGGGQVWASSFSGYPLAELDDGTVVPMSELDLLACDCEMTRVVLDAEGVPQDVGQTQRRYRRELRRAVIVRDRHCRWPGCAIPASWCDVHHIRWFCRGGATSLVNGIALCRHHHSCVHRGDVRIDVTPTGHAFTARNGARLGSSTRQGDSLLAMVNPDPTATPGQPRPAGRAGPAAPAGSAGRAGREDRPPGGPEQLTLACTAGGPSRVVVARIDRPASPPPGGLGDRRRAARATGARDGPPVVPRRATTTPRHGPREAPWAHPAEAGPNRPGGQGRRRAPTTGRASPRAGPQ